MAEGAQRSLLIVITGPVGAGKSTTALCLGDHLRALGRRLAVVDLDCVAEMVGWHSNCGPTDPWHTARPICGGLADALFRQGHDVVIVEGEFYTAGELAALRDLVTIPVLVQLVTLDVSWEACLARVAADPSPERQASRDPAFLRQMHDGYLAALPWLRSAGAVLDAGSSTPEALAVAVRALLPTAWQSYGSGDRVTEESPPEASSPLFSNPTRR